MSEAPFCNRPACSCAIPDASACGEFKDGTDSAGVHRCAECGNRAAAHTRARTNDAPTTDVRKRAAGDDDGNE